MVPAQCGLTVYFIGVMNFYSKIALLMLTVTRSVSVPSLWKVRYLATGRDCCGLFRRWRE